MNHPLNHSRSVHLLRGGASEWIALTAGGNYFYYVRVPLGISCMPEPACSTQSLAQHSQGGGGVNRG